MPLLSTLNLTTVNLGGMGFTMWHHGRPIANNLVIFHWSNVSGVPVFCTYARFIADQRGHGPSGPKTVVTTTATTTSRSRAAASKPLRGHFEVVGFAQIESAYMTSYWTSIVTLVLSCRVSEMPQLLYSESRFFDTLFYSGQNFRVSPLD